MAFGELAAAMQLTVLDLPADAWKIATSLPPLHKDPIDRMMIAHAIVSGMTIVTSDATVREYPVECFW